MGSMTSFLERGLMDEDFPIRIVQTEETFLFAPHWHEEVEIVYVAESGARIELNHHLCELRKGEILMIKPGEVHSFMPGTGRLLIIVFRMYFLTGTSQCGPEEQSLKTLVSHNTVIPAHLVQKANLALMMKAIAEEEAGKQPGYKWAMKARLYDLIVRLIRLGPSQTEEDCPGGACSQSKKFAFIEEVCEYLEQHYDQPLKLDDIAEHTNFNKFYLCKLFKEARGMTVMDYLNQYRISQAKWDLLGGAESILQIAVQSGFNNLNSFNRIFKKYNGCTPSEFRKQTGRTAQ
ncbi:AraC family transcriptional regulator [Paenibacillus sp. XY044]|uniref:AraC family transcriptional regulator n=1 Tax=Paenibacillus sp. XY044 TaxID=2026089 RepID=UPI000B9890F6|nr:AraC family transcriptional regulator [Paenibacillus sp. XY044]OZB95107.1 hypothetical protein CJP46_15525 [Paenibacillus sp. XY044]